MDRFISKNHQQKTNGESTCIIGRSGTGKSWLARQILGTWVELTPDILKSKQDTLEFLDKIRGSNVNVLLDEYECVEDLSGIREIRTPPTNGNFIVTSQVPVKFDFEIKIHELLPKTPDEIKVLFPTADPLTFTAPNLAYLADSPVEFGPVTIRTFTVRDGQTDRPFRFAAHHDGTDAELDALVRDVAAIVREERAVFGELAPYDGGVYTFLADYLPWVDGDAMEHRNSTVMTSQRSIAEGRDALLDTVAHEFFHSWNVERIRPVSLEPFALTDVNMSGELWLAEGFTNYYGSLATVRSGVASFEDFVANLEDKIGRAHV